MRKTLVVRVRDGLSDKRYCSEGSKKAASAKALRQRDLVEAGAMCGRDEGGEGRVREGRPGRQRPGRPQEGLGFDPEPKGSHGRVLSQGGT